MTLKVTDDTPGEEILVITRSALDRRDLYKFDDECTRIVVKQNVAKLRGYCPSIIVIDKHITKREIREIIQPMLWDRTAVVDLDGCYDDYLDRKI